MTALELFSQIQEALGDAYRLERELPGGGMSRLFLATELSLGRQVVIKVLPPEMSGGVSAQRFKREIELTASLQHPHILPVLSAGARDGLLYYVMPYVAGESLRHRLSREGKLPVADACRILREMADALAFAHAEGIVHRDLKPENILLQGAHAVLADFGVAGALAAAQGRPSRGEHKTQLTGTGMAVGTPAYMAPEQLAADAEIDGRADIYALGTIGYEMLAGERPFAELTGPQLLVARLTESPEPLDWLRPDTPEEIGAAIAMAMASDPAHRFQWASEFHDAIEAGAPRSTTRASLAGAAIRPSATGAVQRPRMEWKRIARWGLAAAVVLALGAAGYRAWQRISLAQKLTPNLIAVAPFESLNADIKRIWSEGMIDILSRNLDGMGPLQTVSPTVVIRNWPATARADKTSAAELGRETGAEYVILGGLRPLGIGATPDSVRIEAQVVSTATGDVIRATEISIDGRLEEMTQLSDSLTVRLLRGLGQSAYLGSLRGSDLGTSSLLALKAFLQGEYFYRRTQWDSAFTHYSRAVSLDTTFSLAYHRLGRVYGWQTNSLDSLTHYFRIEAARYNHGLPLRDSLLIAADSIRAVIGAVQTDPEYLDRTRRLFATLHRAVERYPNDPEVWYMLGEAQHHYGYGPEVGVPPELALESFNRAIALDSTFAPAYIHAVELGLMLDTTGRGMDYARKYIALQTKDAEGAGIGLIELLAADPRSESAREALDTSSTSLLRDAFFVVRRWPDENELAVQVARVWLSRALDGPPSDANFARAVLTAELAYRGHLRSAFESWAGASNRAFSDLANAGAIPDDTARKVIGGWIAADDPVAALALPWMAGTGSVELLQGFQRSARSRSRRTNPATGSAPGYDAGIAHAYLLLARGDSSGALAAFLAIPDVSCLGCVADRLVEARLLLEAHRPREAERMLEERLPTLLSPAEVFFQLYLARAARQLGEEERAAQLCGRIARIWRNPDPDLERKQSRVCS